MPPTNIDLLYGSCNLSEISMLSYQSFKKLNYVPGLSYVLVYKFHSHFENFYKLEKKEIFFSIELGTTAYMIIYLLTFKILSLIVY